MGFNSQQIALNSSTPTALIQQGAGTSGNGFVQVGGAQGDELPGIIQNTSASVVVYLGGPDVSSSNGFPLAAGASLPINFLGTDAIDLFAISASDTPSVAVLLGRQ